MRASEFDYQPERVDEVIGALISIKNWFDDKLAKAGRKYGGAVPVSYTHLTLPTNREV